MENIDEKDLIVRRAQMDCRLDIECGELWGEDELVNDTAQILDKLYEVANFIHKSGWCKVGDPMWIAADNLWTHLHWLGGQCWYVQIWRDAYRMEKAMLMMAKEDRRYTKIGDTPTGVSMNPLGVMF